MAQPKLVLPRTEILAKGLPEGLTEIAQSLSGTLVSLAQALPAGGPALPAGLPGLPGQGQGGVKLPKIEQIFKGPTAAMEKIKSTFEATVAGLTPQGGGEKRGTITETPPPSPGGVATRGSL